MRASLLAIWVAAAMAQEPPAFRSQVELVAVPCSVVDAHGTPVPGLTRQDFHVFDNGVPRIVEYLWNDSEQPLTLAVLIDASSSQDELVAEHRRTALNLVQQFLRPTDQVFLISISEDVRLWTDRSWTASQPLGEPCPRRAGVSVCGESPIWNAVYDTARLKLYSMKGAKAILLLTDGFDSGSTRTWNQAAEEAQRAGAPVYAIQYGSAFGGSYAPQLYRMAAETGGAWFDPPGDDYASILARLDADLRRRYVLGFRPENLNFNKPRHEIRVETTRPDLTVRMRKNYFRVPAVQ